MKRSAEERQPRPSLESNVMAKTWVLDSETKGTGARMVPLEDVVKKPEPKGQPAATPPKPEASPAARKPAGTKRPKATGQTRLTPLQPGHVRKKTTGEIGRVKAVDAKAGTATVTWLRDGRTSTVPISSVT